MLYNDFFPSEFGDIHPRWHFRINGWKKFYALQIICVLHCIRRGTTQKWLWLIIFLPFVGGIIFFSELIPRRNTGDWRASAGSLLVSPTARIKRLEDTLSFANTFNYRVLLANAYMNAGRTEEAIELYTWILPGTRRGRKRSSKK